MTGDANSSIRMPSSPTSEPPMNRKSKPYRERCRRWTSESPTSLSLTKAEQLEIAEPWMRTPPLCRWRLWSSRQSTRLSAMKISSRNSEICCKTRLYRPRTSSPDTKDWDASLKLTTRSFWRKMNCSEWGFRSLKSTDKMKSWVWRTNSSSSTRPTPRTLETSRTTKWRCSLKKLRNWRAFWK